MDKKYIEIVNAKVHNLKSVSVNIPRNKLVVITGPSGSGKSSLAFDTLYAEGQRRYIESLSSYARQFIGQMDAPDVESITGLSPSIAIDQKSTTKNPRSTVGTVTEVYDYLRVLFARVGTAYCPESGIELKAQSAQQIVKQIAELPEKTKVQLLSPVIISRKGSHREELSKYASMGFARVRVDGELQRLDDDIILDKNKYHDIEIVVDRVVIKEGIEKRLNDSIEHALQLSNGFLIALIDDEEKFFSEKLYSPKTGKSFPELNPRHFSFNSPMGACKTCNGIGFEKTFLEENLIFDKNLPILEGGIVPLQKKNGFLFNMVKCFLEQEDLSPQTSLSKLPAKLKTALFTGSKKIYNYKFVSENSSFNFKKEFPGIIPWLERKYSESGSEKTKLDIEKMMTIEVCKTCNGDRVGEIARSTRIGDFNIAQLAKLSISKCKEFFDDIELTGESAIIAEKVLKEIRNRLTFLNQIGLSYLTLSRAANTLSGGESQRIRLATQIGSALSGVLYVLDEPSIGLHARDNEKLIATLHHLRKLGNTVIVVEHDEETMRNADYLIDMGPGAGVHGGTIISEGTPEEVMKNEESLTGRYLKGIEKVEVPEKLRTPTEFLKIRGAHKNNIEDLDIDIPLKVFCCVTGVSGSGKSTLIHQILVPAIKSKLRGYVESGREIKNLRSIAGASNIETLIELDQSPIGRTPKSNPATYTGLFDEIRKLFANTNESKVRGYKQGRFSFNVKGGRCDECEGNGTQKIEMHFLPDVYITCPECDGSRYNRETLSVLYKGKNIHQVLNMTVEEAYEFFQNHTKMARILKTLNDVGLGYIKLGQSATTLSGGEAQRLKISKELSKRTKGHCLYILDEPTTGLHVNDVRILINAIQSLAENHSVIVIEHNLDMIKVADHIIDLGPDGGDKGGELVFSGNPKDIFNCKKSLTGYHLNRYM